MLARVVVRLAGYTNTFVGAACLRGAELIVCGALVMRGRRQTEQNHV